MTKLNGVKIAIIQVTYCLNGSMLNYEKFSHNLTVEVQILLRLWDKMFPYGYIQKYTDICIQSASRMQFLGVKKWCSANDFSDTKQKYVC